MEEYFYSNGKILLTGEYLVMLGAKALAFPLKYGQSMSVTTQPGISLIDWKAFSPEGKWFEAVFELPVLHKIQATNQEKAIYLQKILESIQSLNPDIFRKDFTYSFQTEANFSIGWGFGTSSTLIKNLADWAKLDAYDLLARVSDGSGYDIACAGSNSPIIFQKNSQGKADIKQVQFEKSFTNNLYLIYSGKKAHTEPNISDFLSIKQQLTSVIDSISSITEKVLNTNELTDFIELLKEHETIMGYVLNQIPIQKKYFVDFEGVVKSLGAWGGDFILAASDKSPEYIFSYFEQFGLKTIIVFNQILVK